MLGAFKEIDTYLYGCFTKTMDVQILRITETNKTMIRLTA